MQTDGTNSVERLPRQAFLGAIGVRVETDAENVSSEWQWLEEHGFCTYFQTRSWCRSWLKDAGETWKAEPVFVIGTSHDGNPLFLLPLQVRIKRGFRLLEFLSVPHASYGYGLFDKEFLGSEATLWFAEQFQTVLQMLPRCDAVYLRDMPEHMFGKPNPLFPLARFKGANPAYMMMLEPNYDRLLSGKRSADTLRSMRKRDKRLANLGHIEFGLPASADERHKVMQQMFSDQEARLGETGIHDVYGVADRDFLTGLTDPQIHGDAALMPYRLMIGDKIACVLLGGTACNTFWAMITSLADGEWRKHSPGDFTLRHVIAEQCKRDLAWFDFSLGHSDYKLAWADTKIETSLIIQSATLKGLVLALGLATKHKIKRILKRQVVLRQIMFQMRRLLFGKSV